MNDEEYRIPFLNSLPLKPCSYEDLNETQLVNYWKTVNKILVDVYATSKNIKIAGVPGSGKSSSILSNIVLPYFNKAEGNILISTQGRELLDDLKNRSGIIDTEKLIKDLGEKKIKHNPFENPSIIKLFYSTNQNLFYKNHTSIYSREDENGNELPRGLWMLKFISEEEDNFPLLMLTESIRLFWNDESIRLSDGAIKAIENALQSTAINDKFKAIFSYDACQLGMRWCSSDKVSYLNNEYWNEPDLLMNVSMRCSSGIMAIYRILQERIEYAENHDGKDKEKPVDLGKIITPMFENCRDLYFIDSYGNNKIKPNVDTSIQKPNKLNVKHTNKSLITMLANSLKEAWDKETVLITRAHEDVNMVTMDVAESVGIKTEITKRIGYRGDDEILTTEKHNHVAIKDPETMLEEAFYYPLGQIKHQANNNIWKLFPRERIKYKGKHGTTKTPYTFEKMDRTLINLSYKDCKCLSLLSCFTIFSFQGKEAKNVIIFINAGKKRSSLDAKLWNVALSRSTQGIDSQGNPKGGKIYIYTPYTKYNALYKKELNRKGYRKGQAIGKAKGKAVGKAKGKALKRNIEGLVIELGDLKTRLWFDWDDITELNPPDKYYDMNRCKMTVQQVSNSTDFTYNNRYKLWVADPAISDYMKEVNLTKRYKNKPRYYKFYFLGNIVKELGFDSSYMDDLFDWTFNQLNCEEQDLPRYWNQYVRGYGEEIELELKNITSTTIKEQDKKRIKKINKELTPIKYHIKAMGELDNLPIWFIAVRKNNRYVPININKGFMTRKQAEEIASKKPNTIIGKNLQGLNIICYDYDSTEEVNKNQDYIQSSYSLEGLKENGEKSVHSYYIVNKPYSSKHLYKKDVLTNGTYQLDYLKPNKKWNNHELTILPEELVKELEAE